VIVIVIVMRVVMMGVIMRMIVVSGRSSHCPDPLNYCASATSRVFAGPSVAAMSVL
jgi:hypothetical protein